MSHPYCPDPECLACMCGPEGPCGWHKPPAVTLDDLAAELRALRERFDEVFPKAPTPEETLSTSYDASVGWLKDHGNTTAVSATRVEPRPIRDTEPTSC